VRLRVYHQLYNPWSIPFVQRIPLAGYAEHEGEPELGVRVIPSRAVHARLGMDPRRSPRLSDFADLDVLPPLGWRLELFICNELLACREATASSRSATTGSSNSSTAVRGR
jgi:hypothetical protein